MKLEPGSADAAVGPAMEAWLRGRVARDEISEATRATYAGHIAAFVRFVGDDTPLRSIDVDTIEDWIGSLRTPRGAPLQPGARNTKVATIRVFFKWATERELVDRNPFIWVRSAKVPRRLPRRIPAEHINRILANAPFRTRTMAILSLQLGLRRAEIAAMQVEDWDRAGGWLHVRGKGAKERSLPVTVEAYEALTAWLSDGRETGPMWPSSHRPGEGLSNRQVSAVLTEASKTLGLHYSPHQYRHTFATDALQSGATLSAVATALGHADEKTTSRYLSLTPTQLKDQLEGRRYRGVG